MRFGSPTRRTVTKVAIDGVFVLAVVPARSGSKGILRKNLCQIGGKSLVALAAEVSLSVAAIDRAVLSTDDEAIAEEGRRAGLWVPFMRPAPLASDEARSVEVWRHAWLAAEAADGRRYGLSVLLEPSSPLRWPSDVETSLFRMLETGARAAATVSPTPAHYTPHKTLTMLEGNRIGFYRADGARFARRQDIPTYYHRNGICYAARRDTVVEHMTIVEEDCVAIVIDRPVINIDEPSDLEFANYLASKQRGSW
jgi:CMP-N,N'-diacetyllegionaminic acid synthase